MLRVGLRTIRMRSNTGLWACAAAALACAADSAVAQSRPIGTLAEDGVATVPSFSKNPAVTEVKLEPDLTATSFSLQNAYYFSVMSKTVYAPKAEVEGMLKGNATSPGMGFDRFHWFEADPAVSGKSVLDAIQDTEAFVAANDEILLVVFRGTKELTDWTTNLRIGLRPAPEEWGVEEGSDLHQGFDDGVDTVWRSSSPDGMHQTIKRLYNEEGKNRKLYITGHSLGGALATIAAARLVYDDPPLNIEAMYTIGSPRVFDGKMAKIFDATKNYGTAMKAKYFRCRNNNDIVPRVPPSPYQHVGKEIYLDRFGTISTTSILDRLLGRLGALFRGELIDGINDHGTSEYCRLFKQAIVASRQSLLDKTKNVMKHAVQKVMPVNMKETKTQLDEIKAAKEAALEASKVTINPSITADIASDARMTEF